MFADHARRLVAGPVIEILLELAFDDAAFFLDHQHFFLAAHKIQRVAAGQRPDHADLVDVDAQPAAGGLVHAQQAQRFHQVQMALAGGDDAKSGVLDVIDVPVDRVGLNKGLNGFQLGTDAGFDGGAGQVGGAHVQAALGAV